jgi:signal transduction histidine kinase
MRSPLTSILLLAETLQRGQSGPLNEIQRRQLGIIHTGALGLMSIVADLITAGTSARGLLGGDPVPFSVTELLLSLRDMVLPIAEQKGLDLLIRAPALDRRVGHPVPLSRVLLNLVTNALKYTDGGRVEVVVAPSRAGQVRFAVRDTGDGLPADVVARLAVKGGGAQAAQPEQAEPERFSSTALGLNICQGLLAAMGSELHVETEPKRGSKFTFELLLPEAERFDD